MTLILSGTNGVSDIDGSAATPAIRGTDANTGIFFPAADTVGVSTGGSERVRVDSSGNVGIGTSSPVSRLTVAGSSAVLSLIDTDRTVNTYGAVWADQAGNVFLNADYDGTAGGAFISFRSNGSAASAEKMRIDSSGNLLVGTTSVPSTGAGTNSTIVFNKDYSGAFAQIVNSSSTSGTQNFIQFGRGSSECGKITSTGTNSTTYATSSDYRLKKDVQPMTGALGKVAALKPVTYKWTADDSESEGFIAHQLAEVMPQAVVGEKDAVNQDGSINPQGIDTSFLVATLTAAIQEQQSLITALTARIEALETK